jgi:hypothetical protein
MVALAETSCAVLFSSRDCNSYILLSALWSSARRVKLAPGILKHLLGDWVQIPASWDLVYGYSHHWRECQQARGVVDELRISD